MMTNREDFIMKVAISAFENNPSSRLEQRFGRARWFVIYDTDSHNYEFVENTRQLNAAQGAGIQTAGTVSRAAVAAVITGHIGPKAYKVLDKAGVDIYLTNTSTVKDAINKFESGMLNKTQSPDVQGHWM
jgi:predicted Fe-Mo cluster-binding NifX family protein